MYGVVYGVGVGVDVVYGVGVVLCCLSLSPFICYEPKGVSDIMSAIDISSIVNGER